MPRALGLRITGDASVADGERARATGLARRSLFGAVRAEPQLVAVLAASTALAWWSASDRMAGMNAGPGSALGSVTWFTGVWATMMAAMMLPSLAPTAAAFVSLVGRRLSRGVLFVGGYLLVWSVVGLGAYGVFELGSSLLGGALAWHRGGRWLAAAVLVLAALYQVTSVKRAFLERCRSPLPSLDAPLQDTRRRAFVMGLRNGGWCLGCCWALMAALFALGVMSLLWMGLIAALVALEKVGPAGRGASLAAATTLVVLATGILLVPHDVPGLVVPGSRAGLHAMSGMG